MYIENKTNLPSMRGLYFTKATPEFKKYVSKNTMTKLQDSTPTGVKYLEDNTMSKKIKDIISNIPYVKHASKKNDVFVMLSEDISKTNPRHHIGLLRLWKYDHFEKEASQEVFSAVSYSKGRPTERILEQLKNKIIAV